MKNNSRNIFIRKLGEILGDRSASVRTCSGKLISIENSMFDEGPEEVDATEPEQYALRKATTYANFAHRHEVYVSKAKREEVTAYSLALSDWFEAPKVLQINFNEWTGKPCQRIRVKARDNVHVAGVTVVIRDAEGKLVEAGEAVPSKSGNGWWDYTTKAHVKVNPFPALEATARDLAGNSDSFLIN